MNHDTVNHDSRDANIFTGMTAIANLVNIKKLLIRQNVYPILHSNRGMIPGTKDTFSHKKLSDTWLQSVIP